MDKKCWSGYSPLGGNGVHIRGTSSLAFIISIISSLEQEVGTPKQGCMVEGSMMMLDSWKEDSFRPYPVLVVIVSNFSLATRGYDDMTSAFCACVQGASN